LLVIVLLLFGAKRIPELAKGLGTGMREFKSSSSGKYEEVESDKDEKNEEKKDDFDSARADLDEDERKARAENGSSGNVSSENGASDSDEPRSTEAKQEQRG
jgi:sec-independent protein translocase protein TatA